MSLREQNKLLSAYEYLKSYCLKRSLSQFLNYLLLTQMKKSSV